MLTAIKPGDARRRIGDGAGLWLLLHVNGGSHGWRLDYSFQGRRKTLSPGTRPTVGLGAARRKAEEARRQITNGADPSRNRQASKASAARSREIEKLVAAGLPLPGTLEAMARDWYSKQAPSWAGSALRRDWKEWRA